MLVTSPTRHYRILASTRCGRKPKVLFADNQPLLAYVRHCGDLVGQVLRGTESPLETLFPRGSFELAEGLYQRSATMRYVNSLAAASVAASYDGVPAGRPVRILEVGAGTGGTTASLLALLPADRTQYVFTDVSDVFLDRAREQFRDQACLSFGRFDMDQDAAAQGYPAGSFDVIVSANAVHTSVDLPVVLSRLRDLLAPGGLLVLIESTTHFAWFDMTTGLIDGWQHVADDLRRDHPLLSPEAWIAALSDAGFAAARAWPEADSSASHLGQHVLVARVAGVSAAGVTRLADAAAGQGDATANPATEGASAPRERILAAFPTERLAMLRDLVRQQVMRVLRRDDRRSAGPERSPDGTGTRFADGGAVAQPDRQGAGAAGGPAGDADVRLSHDRAIGRLSAAATAAGSRPAGNRSAPVAGGGGVCVAGE